MWKVGLAFFFSRLVLYAAILFAINRTLHPNLTSSIGEFSAWSELNTKLLQRVGEISEAESLDRLTGTSWTTLFTQVRSPYLWLGHLLHTFTPLSVPLCLIVLSNLFFILLLNELCNLLMRFTTTDVAIATPILLLLWPTSYELSLGSSFSAVCWLTFFAVRNGLDDRWLTAGISLGFLGLMDPVAVGILPLTAGYFWFFTRHYQWPQMLKRSAFFLAPLIAVILWNDSPFRELGTVFSQSALMNLVAGLRSGNLDKWTLSASVAGQTITLIAFLAGSIISFAVSPTYLHRTICVYFFLLWLIFSPYPQLASRAAMAGICLQGIASLSAKPILRLIQMSLLSLAIYDICQIFG